MDGIIQQEEPIVLGGKLSRDTRQRIVAEWLASGLDLESKTEDDVEQFIDSLSFSCVRAIENLIVVPSMRSRLSKCTKDIAESDLVFGLEEDLDNLIRGTDVSTQEIDRVIRLCSVYRSDLIARLLEE